MIIGEIVSNNPKLIHLILPDFLETVEYNDTLKIVVPNIVGLVGRISIKVSAEILPIFGKLLDDLAYNVHAITLIEIRNLFRA
ncbi:MAG: hypothetical protein ACFFB5_19975 [Promethearchaeota archaeon]